ncbi:hypothetical protein [Fibrella forsythiae]|uniref:DUF4369 domain-containing protein n=1 Tax=Fibrella forsythiae TaxID=2817061 RepID=A0ABS3JEM2_9BACT|nr:hypothetical protein [Fibrella forsythiae]MBO0948459.1 hypothetical protein [Fibrella forsythiae]
MNVALFVGAFGLLATTACLAQSTGVIRVKGSEQAVSYRDRYQYDQFRNGTVAFLNGTTVDARFNYHVILGEMHFITARGDTMALTEEPIVRLVEIINPSPAPDSPRTALFLYDQRRGYTEIVADYDGIKLAAKQGLRTTKREKMSAYGQSTGAGAITTYQFYSGGNMGVSKLDAKGDLLFSKETTYFFVDKNNRLYPATKANLIKLYGNHRQQIATYLETDPVDFSRNDQLTRLLAYCSKLM